MITSCVALMSVTLLCLHNNDNQKSDNVKSVLDHSNKLRRVSGLLQILVEHPNQRRKIRFWIIDNNNLEYIC